MKERKFVRGTKGANIAGTKTHFRNYRKEQQEFYGYSTAYKDDLTSFFSMI